MAFGVLGDVEGMDWRHFEVLVSVEVGELSLTKLQFCRRRGYCSEILAMEEIWKKKVGLLFVASRINRGMLHWDKEMEECNVSPTQFVSPCMSQTSEIFSPSTIGF